MNSTLLATLISSGATTPALPSAWREAMINAGAADGQLSTFLKAQGHAGAVPDMFAQYLKAKGYTGTLSDMLRAASVDDNLFAQPHPLISLFDGRDGFLYDGAFSAPGVNYGLDDAGATSCTSSGDVCLFVKDHSGNGRNLKQPTSAAGLIYRVDGSGRQSFITGNTTAGGTGRYAIVDGITALPQNYTDIVVFKSLDIAGNNGLTNTYENFSYTPSPFSDYRHLALLRVGGTGRYTYAYNHGTQSQDITFGTDIAALGEVGWTTHRIGGGVEAAYSGIMSNWDTNIAGMLTSGFAQNTSGPSGVLDDGTRTQLGLNDSADVSNLEYVFRMRVYATLTAGELETVTAYLNSSGIYAWTGGTP